MVWLITYLFILHIQCLNKITCTIIIQFIFFVWSYPTCCVASLRAVLVGCISYKPVYCVTFGHSVEGD